LTLALRVVKVLLNAHWLLVFVETSEDWTWPIVKLFIVYYVSYFYGGINITMTTTAYITIDSRKRASGNTCDAVYFLDRTLQGVPGLKLSNMQFFNTIYNITQYNNTIAFSVTSSGTTTPYSLTLAPGNYVVSEFTAALDFDEQCLVWVHYHLQQYHWPNHHHKQQFVLASILPPILCMSFWASCTSNMQQ